MPLNPSEIFNATQVIEISSEQFVTAAHTFTAIPSALLLFLAMGTIFLIVGLATVSGRSRGSFVGIWFISMVLSSIVLLMIIYMPSTIQSLAEGTGLTNLLKGGTG